MTADQHPERAGALPAEPLAPVEVGTHQRWNEAQYTWWYDVAAGVSGYHRVAHLPNDGAGKAHLWQALLTHDGRRYRRCDELRFRPEWRQGGAYRAEGLELRRAEDGLSVAYESEECGVDLRFSDFHRPVSPTALAAGEEPMQHLFSGHVEVGGAVRGTVVIDGEEIEVDGLGYRDHSWGGSRDMRPFRSTRWCNGTVGPELTFGVAYMTTGGFGDHQFGYLVRDGVPVSVPDFDLIVDYEVDGVCWRTASLVLHPAEGPEVAVELGPSFDGVVFESQEWLPYECATRITADGATGVGNVECTTNPRGGLEHPRSVLRGCFQEGLSQRPGSPAGSAP